MTYTKRSLLDRILVNQAAAKERDQLIMATLAELQDALGAANAALDAATAGQLETQQQITQLAEQVAAIIAGSSGSIPAADLDPIVAGLNAIAASGSALAAGETVSAASVDAIVEPDPGEEPVAPA